MKEWIFYPLAASSATMVLHFVAGLSWGLAAFAAFVGWPLIGTLITADDDFPGGWSNPDGTRRPDWLTAAYWGQICAGLAVSALIGALDAGVFTQLGGTLGGVAGVCGGISALLLAQRGKRGSAQTEQKDPGDAECP